MRLNAVHAKEPLTGVPLTGIRGSEVTGESYLYIGHGSARTSNQRIAIPRPTSLNSRPSPPPYPLRPTSSAAAKHTLVSQQGLLPHAGPKPAPRAGSPHI